jgi:hypothetical protein
MGQGQQEGSLRPFTEIMLQAGAAGVRLGWMSLKKASVWRALKVRFASQTSTTSLRACRKIGFREIAPALYFASSINLESRGTCWQICSSF